MKAPQLLCSAVALTVAVTACHRPASQADAEQTASDAAARVKAESAKARDQLADVWLSTKVHSKFVADRDINGANISVSSHDGVVTLRGRVLNEPMRDLAVAIARNTVGVTQVVNQLSVEIAGPARPQGSGTPGAVPTTGTVNTAPSTAPIDDARITSSIQSKYYLDDRIRGRRIAVSSHGGVVALSGDLGDETEREHALLLARTTDGVSRVEDSLTIAAAPATPAQPTAAAPDADETLGARVRSQLTSDTRLKGASIDVTAKNGVVLLQGTTSSNAAKQRALTLARGTEGVHQIVDRIRVGKAPLRSK